MLRRRLQIARLEVQFGKEWRLNLLGGSRCGLERETIARETSACREVFVYFKHEEAGKGPEFARSLMAHLKV